MELPDRSQAKSWEGKEVVDRDGQRLGRCVGVFADTATGVPEWLHVDVEDHVRSFVPALDASERDGTVHVPFARDAVVGAPTVGDDDQLSKAEEIELYSHYGVPVERDEGSVLPSADATAASPGTVETASTDSTATMPVAGTSDRTGTAAASSSGADTTGAEADAGAAPAGGPWSDSGDTTALRDGTDDDGTLLDEGGATGADVTPETGEQLPVLDPAAASTTVPEGHVHHLDEPEPAAVADEVPPAPAAAAPGVSAEPRPALRPVPPASPPLPPPPSSSSDDLSSLTPLGAVAGVAAAVAVVLHLRDRRQRRRNSAAARAGRLGDSLRAGSVTALTGVAGAAEVTRRSAATATDRAAKAAARQQRRAAAASRRQRAQAAAVLAAASKTAEEQKRSAARTAAQQRKTTQASLAAASKSAAKQRKATKASLAAASKSAAKQRKAAAGSLAAVSSRGSSTAGSITAVPRGAAKRGRRLRRSLARKIWRSVLLGTAGGGYVLGAKAGRERYEELSQVAAAVAGNPKVQSATEAVKDPERRTDLLNEVQQQAGSLVGRRGEPRS